jgi:hypothetical protein
MSVAIKGRGAALLGALAALLAAWMAVQAAPSHADEGPPHINHLFVIVLENENAEETFGANPPAPYLGTAMRAAGAFIPNYYGIGHESLDNYIAMVSGQPPNLATQSDCQVFSAMAPGTVGEDGVAVGQGCVFPTAVQTVANQLEQSGHTWRGYMEDMANSAGSGQPATCRHPALNAPDETQKARATDQYAVRHDPFVYFHSIIDYSTCQRNVVDLSRLPEDLASESTTPEYAFITPDLCADGHDATCADGVSPGGFAGIEAFLRQWVPRIEASAAFRDRGAILVTFDESASGAGSCCGETTGPNTPNNGGPDPGSGGGRVGAVMVSPCIQPGTVTDVAYNHYSLLRSVEDNFGLAHLANADTSGLRPFGTDVLSRPSCDVASPIKARTQTRLQVRPRRAVAGKRRTFRFRLFTELPACQQGAIVRFAGHRATTNLEGRAHIRARLHRGAHPVATVTPQLCGPSQARVHVLRRKRRVVAVASAESNAR